MLANYSFAHTTSPTFTIMSAYDWWSSMCILFAEPVRAAVGGKVIRAPPCVFP